MEISLNNEESENENEDMLAITPINNKMKKSDSIKSLEINTSINDLKKVKLWIPKTFHITCCLGGTPMITQSNVSF